MVVGVGQDQRELLAADPRAPHRCGAWPLDRDADPLQREVARLVAGAVVDLLEEVEVADEDGHRCLAAARRRARDPAARESRAG